MRKAHLDQDEIAPVLREVGGSAALPDIAAHFGVSEATARRKLDGLVHQGLLKVYPGRPRTYEVVDEVVRDAEGRVLEIHTADGQRIYTEDFLRRNDPEEAT